MGAASLGVRARLAGATASAVTHAREVDRSVVRVWCMRGTLHLVAASDAHWLVALLGPIALRRFRRRHAEMGVDSDEVLAAVRAALAESGPLNRHELADAVGRRGVRLADDPQAPAHLVGRAALAGLVCEAEIRSGRPTYALVDDWLGPPEQAPLAREAMLVELARRYVTAHAPAGPEDFAAWAGLTRTDARRTFGAVAGEFDEVRWLDDRAGLKPRGVEAPEPPPARLLPAFDGLLLAHRDRALTVRPELARQVYPGGGILRPTVLLDGEVGGTWRLDRGRPALDPPGSAAGALAAEAADVVRFRAA
jgi:hypothetical protein